MNNIGHGHVYPREDGLKARCGGVGVCMECSLDADQKKLDELEDSQPTSVCSYEQERDAAAEAYGERAKELHEELGYGPLDEMYYGHAIQSHKRGSDWGREYQRKEDAVLISKLREALWHYESAHYDHRGNACYHDRVAGEALAALEAAGFGKGKE